MTLTDRLSRISLFRWRLEWAALLLVAVSVVLAEQAREQRGRDPYLIVQSGHSATASVSSGRIEYHAVSPRWMRSRQELRVFLDLHWLDRDGSRRSIERYLLDFETMLALQIDPAAPVWPQEARILYLDGPAGPPSHARPLPLIAHQRTCQPRKDCRVLVLAPQARSQAELDADLADYLAEWAPRGLWLGLIGFLGLLGFRLVGLIDSRPSLE